MWGWGWKVWDRSQSAGCMWWQYVQCTVYCTLYSGQCTGCTVPGQSVLACHARRSALQHCCMLPAVTYCSLQTDQHRDISRQLWLLHETVWLWWWQKCWRTEVRCNCNCDPVWDDSWISSWFRWGDTDYRPQSECYLVLVLATPRWLQTWCRPWTLPPSSSVIPGYYHKC